ncbi:MAG: trimethylamine methyltransferase family protein [Actinomycetota bacterium]
MAVKGFAWAGEPLEPLSKEQEQLVHERSLDVLQRIGVSTTNDRTLKIMAEQGQDVDFEERRIRFDPAFVEQQIALGRGYYTLGARDPENDLVLDGRHGYISSEGCLAEIYDPAIGDRRYSSKEDLEAMTRLSDALPQIAFLWQPVSANDKIVPVRPMHETHAQWSNTTKHIQQMTAVDPFNARGILEMATVVAGSAEALRERPLISNFQCAISPLHWDDGPVDAIELLGQAGIPVGLVSMPLLAATSPASVAGTLVLANAEILSGMVIQQTLVPGAPTFYTCYATTMDMNSGALNNGWGPEDLTFEIAGGQMARRYGVPSSSGILATGAKQSDWQAGMQTAFSAFEKAVSPSDMLSGAGSYNGSAVFSAVQMILDCEVSDIAMRWAEGYSFDAEQLAVEVIEHVGPGGHFLGEPHTLQHMRDFWRSKVMNRLTWEDWDAAGRPEPWKAAEAEVQRILAEHEPEPLPEDVTKELDRIMDAYEAEAMENMEDD